MAPEMGREQDLQGDWGWKQERELAKLEKQRKLHYENVQVLKGNIELLKSSSYELSLKIKDSRKSEKTLTDIPNGISENSTTSVEWGLLTIRFAKSYDWHVCQDYGGLIPIWQQRGNGV